jgi:hypothetical protein
VNESTDALGVAWPDPPEQAVVPMPAQNVVALMAVESCALLLM